MLAKPLFGSIADRFRCQKPIFLTALLLTTTAFLAVFYTPKLEMEQRVNFSCQYNTPAFNTSFSSDTDACAIQQIQGDTTIGHCKVSSPISFFISQFVC